MKRWDKGFEDIYFLVGCPGSVNLFGNVEVCDAVIARGEPDHGPLTNSKLSARKILGFNYRISHVKGGWSHDYDH